METRRIVLFDTTLRDGEQSPGASLYPQEKIRIALQLARLGVDVIEPGFPASSPGDFQAVQQISRLVEGAEICGFGRTVKGDIDAAVRATEDAARRRLHLFVSSSQIHLDFQLRKTQQQVLQMTREMIEYAKQSVEAIEFSPMDATRTGEEFLFQMVETAIEAGATIINMPDTVGYALPEEYGRMFARVRGHVRGGEKVLYSAHCHNDLGLAVANSLAAVMNGATQIQATINGIGERAGNCSLEEVAMAIDTRWETLLMQTGIRQSEIYETSRLVSRVMNLPIPHNKPVVGRNAFQHEAGIHQDGLLKNRNTYEIMDPEKMGIPRSMIVLGKHSGRHAIKHRIAELGVKLTDEQLDRAFSRFKEVADAQKTVSDDDLVAVLGETVNQVIEPHSLIHIQVVSNSQAVRMASARIRDNQSGSEQTYSSFGEGPIEAVVHCIQQAINLDVQFDDLELHSAASGSAAKGEAIVTVSAKGERFRGSSVDTDVIFAVAKAYLSACNQAVRAFASLESDSEEAAQASS